MKTTKCPESLCPVLRYLHWRGVSHLLGGRCPSLIAPTDSCAKPAWLSPPSVFNLVRGVFAGRFQPLLPTGSSRRYLCESFLGCLIPYPGGSTKCFYLFLLLWHRPSPKKETGRLPQFLANTTFREAGFRGCRYFFMFRPPSLLVSQIVPTAAVLPQGSRDFYFRAERASLPLHAPDMLTVRIQVIDGTRTFTLLDSQPCRLLILPSCYSSYGAWTLTPVGLSPTVHASLRWTHASRYQSGKLPRSPPILKGLEILGSPKLLIGHFCLEKLFLCALCTTRGRSYVGSFDYRWTTPSRQDDAAGCVVA